MQLLSAKSAGWVLGLVLVVLAATLTLAQSASAAPPVWTPCTGSDLQGAECTFIQVPLDYSGRVPGTVDLRVVRRVTNPDLPYIVFLQGGPGGAGASLLAAGGPWEDQAFTGKYNFLTFDQRGTGESGALDCPSLQDGAYPSLEHVNECLKLLGQRASLYTTQDTVKDMVHIFSALGLDKVTLFGYSYGTEVALVYAREHPATVDRLILDSVDNPNSQDLYSLGAIKTLADSIESLCPNQCHGVSKTPARDFYEVVEELEKHPQKVELFGPNGEEFKRELTASAMVGALGTLDYSPVTRALAASADVAALHGNFYPLDRLVFDLVPAEIAAEPVADEEPEPGEPFTPHTPASLFSFTRFDASCEELPLPWAPLGSTVMTEGEVNLRREKLVVRTASLMRQLGSALSGIPAPIIYFAVNKFSTSSSQSCISWPGVEPVRPATKGLPFAKVPTYILQGSDDVRTPPLESEEVARQIPGSVRVLVLGGGHSIALDQSDCARKSLEKFLTSTKTTGPSETTYCDAEKPDLITLQVLPSNIDEVPQITGVAPPVGRVVEALRATLRDYSNIIDSLAISSSAFGGLYSGDVSFDETGSDFHDYSVIKGFAVSGRFDSASEGKTSTLSIRLRGKYEGNIKVTFERSPFVRFAGTLDNHNFNVTIDFWGKKEFIPLA